jgi:hypothetical protein
MFHPFQKNTVSQSSRPTKKAFYFIPIFVLVAVFAGNKLEYWEKKDSSQWSQKECRKLLEDSPWVKQYVITSPWMETTQNSGSAAPPVVRYTVQLRSARPVMQAVDRLNQLTGLQSASGTPGARGFGKAPGFGQMGFDNPITVHIICRSDNYMVDWSMFNYWTKQSVDRLKDFVSLGGEKGAKVSVSGYVPPYFFGAFKNKSINNEFEFLFPRRTDDRETLSAEDEFLELGFPHPNFADTARAGTWKGPYDPSRGRDDFINGLNNFTKCIVKFKTDTMKFQEKITY